MDINRILSGEAIVFEGFLNKSEEKHISVQLHPGLTVDVAKGACASIEEAADPVTGRTYVRITLKPDADINATFQPRLARLALMQGESGVPFSMGGLPEGVEEGPIYVAKAGPIGTDTGDFGGMRPGRPYGTPTIGEFATRSNKHFWGWVNDDKTYSDRQTDWIY